MAASNFCSKELILVLGCWPWFQAGFSGDFDMDLVLGPADSGFYIEKGKLKLTVISNRGKEAVVAILNSGDFFGEGCPG
jgi:hypothetical protein